MYEHRLLQLLFDRGLPPSPMSTGPEIVLENAGKDATDAFEDIGHSKNAKNDLAKLKIGVVKGFDAKNKVSSGSKSSSSSGSSNGGGASALRTAIVPLVLLAIILYFKFFAEQN